jgi:hypothetical protein
LEEGRGREGWMDGRRGEGEEGDGRKLRRGRGEEGGEWRGRRENRN